MRIEESIFTCMEYKEEAGNLLIIYINVKIRKVRTHHQGTKKQWKLEVMEWIFLLK